MESKSKTSIGLWERAIFLGRGIKLQEATETRSHAIKGLLAEAMPLREVTAKAGHIQSYTRLFENWIEPLMGNLPIHDLKATQVGQLLHKLATEEVSSYSV